jgi:SAM-dependent methyltransferase
MSTDLARAFDAMAGSYDQLEPWYEHLYAVLHAIVRAQLPRSSSSARALDVGCGTGYQTAILHDMGYETHGVDISAGLLTVACSRCPEASFALGDAAALPYPDDAFDVITCCGSTLSFVEDPARALREIGRVLRSGGCLLLECEHRWSLDLPWALVSALTGDGLGYGLTVRQALEPLRWPWRETAMTHYPLPVAPGLFERVALRLFTRSALAGMLAPAGLTTVRSWGIHMLTNLIPSTVLHRETLARWTGVVYRLLCAADGGIRRSAAAQHGANSLVLLAIKQQAAQVASSRSAREASRRAPPPAGAR